MQPQLQLQLQPQLHPPLQPQLQLHPPVQPQPQLHPQPPLQPQPPVQPPPQLFPPQPQLFPPPQPQQQNRMMMSTIHRQPLSFPLLKHIVSHLSLDPGPRWRRRDLGFEIFYALGFRREPDP